MVTNRALYTIMCSTRWKIMSQTFFRHIFHVTDELTVLSSTENYLLCVVSSTDVSITSQCCAWMCSVSDRSWTWSYFGRMWTERSLLYFHPMKVIVNAFILALWTALSHSLTSFKRVPDFHRAFQVKTRLKHTVNNKVAEKNTQWSESTKTEQKEPIRARCLMECLTAINHCSRIRYGQLPPPSSSSTLLGKDKLTSPRAASGA